jgi:hypothetical protein
MMQSFYGAKANVGHYHWENIKNHRLFFDFLAECINIQLKDDWYKITKNVIEKNGGSGNLYFKMHNI